jgi:hypothetical protein
MKTKAPIRDIMESQGRVVINAFPSKKNCPRITEWRGDSTITVSFKTGTEVEWIDFPGSDLVVDDRVCSIESGSGMVSKDGWQVHNQNDVLVVISPKGQVVAFQSHFRKS